jgi:YD repeat-containing protein
MKLKIAASCLLFVAIFLSCKKEDLSTGLSSGNSGNTAALIISKVLIDNQCANEYVYNDSNLVTTEKSKFDFTTYHYNALGQLASTDFYGNDDILSSDALVVQAAMNSSVWVTSANGVNGGSLTYYYNDNGQLTKTAYTRPLLTSSENSEFIYDSNNRISRQTMYWENAATGYIDYSYDGKGNLIKEMLYNLPSVGAAELITTTQYEFDSKLNPYKFFSKLLLPGIDTNPNNIIKETYTIHLSQVQGTDKAQITQTTYTYNKMGYPITKNGNISYIYN